MSDELFGRIFAPQSFQSREQRVFGIVTAIVDKVEEGGMYRLKFHGMNGQDDDDHSAPARVMMPMASGQYGMHFFPEQGDEVVVGFQVGDTNTPIILGAVYNKGNPPPSQAKQSASNDLRTIVSRSGHQLTFDDTAGAEKVTIQTQGGHSIVFDDSPAGMKITLSTTLGHTIVLDDAPPGKISIQTPTCQMTLAEPGIMTIQAAVSISLNAPSITLAGVSVGLGGGGGTTMVDGIPFKLHEHVAPPAPPAFTGPVASP